MRHKISDKNGPYRSYAAHNIEHHGQKMANSKVSSSLWSQIELHIPSVLPKKCTKIFST